MQAFETMKPNKSVLTTGEVAKLCNVAPRTVSKWFDSGGLRGYRIPGSKDRRIPVEQLVRFMRLHGMPLNGLDTGCKRVLVFDSDRRVGEALRAVLTERGGYEVTLATSAFEAGALAQETRPHAMVIDTTAPDVDVASLGRFMRATAPLQATKVIGTSPDMSERQGQMLLQHGFHAFIQKPFDAEALIRLIETEVPALTP